MYHVYPIRDLIEHELEGTDCPCNPKIDIENMLVIHESMDRREVFEQKKGESMEHEMFVAGVHRRQDYSQELFNLSRHHIADDQFGSSFTRVVVERLWCSDVAGYIASLENKIKEMEYRQEKMNSSGVVA